MLRSSLIAATAALLCSAATAQNVDLSRVYPVTAPVKDAGIYSMKTGKFYPRSQAAALGAAQQGIFDNTCTWAGGAFYTGGSFCDDFFDEGRVPAAGPVGATATNNTNTWQIAYCTFVTTGAVDIDFEVYDTNVLGGDCLGGVPHGPGGGIVGFDSSAAGFPLPGSLTCGAQACWIVTFTTTSPVCMNSGATSTDKFNWRFRNNNTLAQGCAGVDGPILSGEPLIPGGACTYTIACGVDPIFGNPCGHGLDSADLFWINVDGDPVGVPPSAACIADGSPNPYGTNCYWFGGYPTNPFAGIWFRMEADGNACGGCTGNVSTYCTSKVNSLGCTPAIATSGVPDFNAGSGFVVSTTNEVGNKNGLYFHGTIGKQAAAFQGGHLCTKPPLKRHKVQSSGGVGTACNGMYTEDFNVYIAAGTDPALIAGATFDAQTWSRDPSSPSTTNLSNAIEATICP